MGGNTAKKSRIKHAKKNTPMGRRLAKTTKALRRGRKFSTKLAK